MHDFFAGPQKLRTFRDCASAVTRAAISGLRAAPCVALGLCGWTQQQGGAEKVEFCRSLVFVYAAGYGWHDRWSAGDYGS